MRRGQTDPDPEQRRGEDGDGNRPQHQRPPGMPGEGAGPFFPAERRVVPGEPLGEPARPVDPAPDHREQGREERGREQHRHADDDQTPDAQALGFHQRGEHQRPETHDDSEPGGEHRRPRGADGARRRLHPPVPSGELFAEPGHDQQRVIDPHAQADHGGEVEHEDRHRCNGGHQSDHRDRHGHGQEADQQWQHGRHQRAEGEYQDDQRDRDHPRLDATAVVGAHDPYVEIEGRATGHPGAIGVAVGHLGHRLAERPPEGGHHLADAVTRRGIYRNKQEGEPPVGAQEQGILRGAVGDDRADVGFPPKLPGDRIEHRRGKIVGERDRTLDHYRKEFAERSGEAAVEEAVGAGRLGFSVGATADAQEFRGMRCADHSGHPHHCPERHDEPAEPDDESRDSVRHQPWRAAGDGRTTFAEEKNARICK